MHLKISLALFAAILPYILISLLVFDFSEEAVPYDEESFAGKPVAIGPRPRRWVPGATHDFDISGGPDYCPENWPCRAWKPICLIYCKMRGFELPGEWR